MSAQAERKAIGTLFNTGWGTTTPVSYENRDYRPPASSEWVRLKILAVDSFRTEIGTGARHERTVGLVTVQVFVPGNTGDGRAFELGDMVADIFRSQQVQLYDPADGVTVIGRILFRIPTVRNVGVGDQVRVDNTLKGLYYQVNVSVPYLRDSFH